MRILASGYIIGKGVGPKKGWADGQGKLQLEFSDPLFFLFGIVALLFFLFPINKEGPPGHRCL